MKQGLITRVLDYYFMPENRERFGKEIDRAVAEFFDGFPKNGLDPKSAGHLEEWFLYDFKLKNGKTPLADFYDSNPLNMDDADLDFYKDLQTNEYGLFEVAGVDKDRSLRLKSIRSGIIYDIKEKIATQQLNQKDTLIIRVVKAGDHYELAGGSAIRMPYLDNKLKLLISKTKDKLTPKIVYRILIARDTNVYQDGSAMLTGSFDGAPVPEDGYDDCAVCRLMRKAKTEGREPTAIELKDAFEEAEREKIKC